MKVILSCCLNNIFSDSSSCAVWYQHYTLGFHHYRLQLFWILSWSWIPSIYSLLNSHNVEPLNTLRTRWQDDLNVIWTDRIWQNGMTEYIHCHWHSVIQFKVAHRLHRSKVKLAKNKPDIDPTCDRCKQARATILHVFWSCPKLSNFWPSFFSETLAI